MRQFLSDIKIVFSFQQLLIGNAKLQDVQIFGNGSSIPNSILLDVLSSRNESTGSPTITSTTGIAGSVTSQAVCTMIPVMPSTTSLASVSTPRTGCKILPAISSVTSLANYSSARTLCTVIPADTSNTSLDVSGIPGIASTSSVAGSSTNSVRTPAGLSDNSYLRIIDAEGSTTSSPSTEKATFSKNLRYESRTNSTTISKVSSLEYITNPEGVTAEALAIYANPKVVYNPLFCKFHCIILSAMTCLSFTLEF